MIVTERLHRNRTVLALHLLRPAPAEALPLLRLHALGDRAVAARPLGLEGWPGAVWGLDFTGHGASTRPVGGGYSPEGLMADADAALAHIGSCVVVGWGLGGYVGLLLAGARPGLVQGLVIADGHGLDGAELDAAVVTLVEHPPPPLPRTTHDEHDEQDELDEIDASSDPYAWAELQVDGRSASYALGYLERAVAGRPPEQALRPLAVVAVGAGPRAGWLAGIESHPAVRTVDGLGVATSAGRAERVAAALSLLAAR